MCFLSIHQPRDNYGQMNTGMPNNLLFYLLFHHAKQPDLRGIRGEARDDSYSADSDELDRLHRRHFIIRSQETGFYLRQSRFPSSTVRPCLNHGAGVQAAAGDPSLGLLFR